MTEKEARDWIRQQFGDAALERLGHFAELVITENTAQNLIAPSTVAMIWARHIVDSAQLVALGQPGLWVDIGTGGGFPGLVIAILRQDLILLVEPRGKRAEFLQRASGAMELRHVRVHPYKVETVNEPGAVISARAVGSVEKLLQIAGGCATSATRWLLPRGSIDPIEVDRLRSITDGMFHVKQSVTEATSNILVIDGVGRR